MIDILRGDRQISEDFCFHVQCFEPEPANSLLILRQLAVFFQYIIQTLFKGNHLVVQHAFVGIVDDLGLAQGNRIGIFIETDMLSDKLTDLWIPLFCQELSAGEGMVFFGFKAAGLNAPPGK